MSELPVFPDLERLRKTAKALLHAAEDADPAALQRLRAVPKLAALPDAEIAARAQLADAQHVIAREHGAESWPKLKRIVEAGMPLELQAEYFLRYVRDDQPEAARGWLERSPAIAQVNIFTAAAAGDAAAVEALLARDASLANAKHSLRGFTALLYAASSPLPEDSPSLTRISRALIDAGADARVHYPGDGENEPLSALYRACWGGHAGVARALLEHGAETQDGESIYHAAQRDRTACLQALADHGADFSGRQSPWGNTPLYFLAGFAGHNPATEVAQRGMRWLLEHGADPNVTSGQHGETPLHQIARFGGGVGIARALIEHGANVNAARTDNGATPYAIAYRRGDEPLCALLLASGASDAIAPFDRIVGLVLRGDVAAARALKAANPDVFRDPSEEQRTTIVVRPDELREGSLEELVALGMDLGWEGPWGGTPLHWAAWHGKVDLAKRLVALGAPRDLRDRTYGSSPLAWCVHGSQNCRSADDEYLAIAQMLLEAGSSRAATFNKWNEPPEKLGSRRLNAFIERWYREHPEQLAS